MYSPLDALGPSLYKILWGSFVILNRWSQELFLLKKKQIPNWLVVYLPLWKMMEFVSWDDDIPNRWKNPVKSIKPL